MPTPACTPEVQRRRNELFGLAAHRIGSRQFEDGSRVLLRENIPAYLNTIGCPMLFERPLALVAITEAPVRAAVDEAAQSGYFAGYSGMALSPANAEMHTVALEYAAVASSEFLRRSRCVAWRSAEGIFSVAPRRVIHDEEDELINEEFVTLTHTYELLVIYGIQPFGHTEYEERTFIKVLNERRAVFAPTIIILAPSVGDAAPEHSPVSQYLVNNYLTVTL